MSNPKPEHRITAVEKRVTNIEGAIEELASDTSEGLNALARDNTGITTILNDLSAKVHQGFAQVHTHINENVASKEDISKLETRIERIETRLDTMATKDDMTAMKQELLEAIKQLKQ
jgi:uncharacterized coiled-coil protein SlyX